MSSHFYLDSSEIKRWKRYLSLVAQNYIKNTGFLDLVHLIICIYEYSVAFIATKNNDVFKSSTLLKAFPTYSEFIVYLTRIRNAAVHRPTGPYSLYDMIIKLLYHKEELNDFIENIITTDDTSCYSYVACAFDTAFKSMIENKKVGDL